MTISHETSGDLLLRALNYLTADDLKVIAAVLQRGVASVRNDYGVACVAGGPQSTYAVDLLRVHDRANAIVAAAEEAARQI